MEMNGVPSSYFYSPLAPINSSEYQEACFSSEICLIMQLVYRRLSKI